MSLRGKSADMTPSRPPVREAHALTLFRGLKNGEGRAYTAVTFPRDPWRGCEHTIRTARACGFVTDWEETPPENAYGVLDVLDENGNIVQDFAVPTAKAFRWFKRHLKLRVEREEVPA